MKEIIYYSALQHGFVCGTSYLTAYYWKNYHRLLHIKHKLEFEMVILVVVYFYSKPFVLK